MLLELKDKRGGLSNANPVISSLTVSGTNADNPTVSWTTDILSDSQVLWGVDVYVPDSDGIRPLSVFTLKDTTLRTSHSVILQLALTFYTGGLPYAYVNYRARAISRLVGGEIATQEVVFFWNPSI